MTLHFVRIVCVAAAFSIGAHTLGAEAIGAADYDAAFVGMRVPDKVAAWEVFPVAVTMRNTGTRPWEGAPIRLRAADSRESAAWGTDYILIAQGTTVAPGAEYTFRSNLRAPGEPGARRFEWRLCKDGTMWFGAATPDRTIEIAPRPAPARTDAAPPMPASGAKKVLGVDDLKYLGSFKAPKTVGAARGAFSESGLALRPMPGGRDRLFMNYTHPAQVLFEVEIPALVPIENGAHAGLQTAEVKKVWGALSASEGGGETLRPNGGFVWNEERRTLWWTWYHGYKTGDAPPVLAATRLSDDGAATTSGPWRVTAPGGLYKSYWGGVVALPASFAEEYTGGKTLALGFGGYYSICAAASRGPALGCIPEPDPAEAGVPVTALLYHPQDAPAVRDGNYFSANCGFWSDPPAGPEKGAWTFDDSCRAGVYIDTPKGHAYIAFVRLGTGRLGYDFGAITSAGDAECWYFYDPCELGKAARGEKRPWETAPSSMAPVRYPLGRTVTGACFDARAGRLYLCVSWAYPEGLESYPVLHVYGL